MKLKSLPILASLFVSLVGATAATPTDGESFVLAEKQSLPPAGSVLTKESSMVMADAVMIVTLDEQSMEGSATQTVEGKETFEYLTKDKFRQLIVSKKTGGKMILNEQAQPSPEKPDPLEGLPVILERKEGTWTATLENGATPNAEQKKRLDKMVEEAAKDADFKMYGDTPRKVGDKWAADPSVLTNFGDAVDVKGTFAVEFVEVKEIAGVRCAVLKSTFEFKGKSESSEQSKAMDITMEGEAIAHRSLADRVDLGVEIKGTMTVDGSPAPNVTIQMEGPMTMTQKVALKKP